MNAREILMQDIIKAVQNGATAVRNNCPNNEGDPRLQSIVVVFSAKIAELMIEIEQLKLEVRDKNK